MTFWSIYILDKLISCAYSRPPAILDQDCLLQLPCDEEALDEGERSPMPTLEQMQDWQIAHANPVTPFALTVVTSSIFGRCARYVHGRSGTKGLPPWDPKSDFTATNSSLMLLESHLNAKEPRVHDPVQPCLSPSDSIDARRIGHLAFSQALFHLCHSLLNHPFLMHLRLRDIATRPPDSFTSRTFSLSQEHARQLSDLLARASQGLVSLDYSFYAFCAAVAAGIHGLALSLAQHQINEEHQATAQTYFRRSLEVLDRLGGLWPMAAHMVCLPCPRAFLLHSRCNWCKPWFRSRQWLILVNESLLTGAEYRGRNCGDSNPG